jgi:hypothetical protein
MTMTKKRSQARGLALIYVMIFATVIFYGLAIDPLLDHALLWLETWLTK